MSGIKALDKLRHNYNVEPYADLQKCCDEIEAEVADNYTRLPCDKDGVPIHIGDKLEKDGEVIGNVTAVGFHDEPRVWVLPNGKQVSISFLAEDVKHYVPRTLEDVLRDVWTEALDYAKNDVWRNPDEVFAERAAEIRKLLGEGEVIDDGGLIADALAPVCVDEKERRAFERGRVHERFAQQIFKEATS